MFKTRAIVPSIEPELRISPWPAILVLAVIGMAFIAVRDFERLADVREMALAFTLVTYLLVIMAALATLWRPAIGRWMTVLAGVGLVFVAEAWFGLPALLALLGLPTALAAALINVRASAATGASLSLLLILGAWPGIGAFAPGQVALTLFLIWGAFGIMAGAYKRIGEVAAWCNEYYAQGRALLEEAQNNQMALYQALEDLAQANRQLIRLNALAQGLRQAAEDAHTAKTRFVANVSHELRTPLNMITGFSEIILQAPQAYGNNIPASLLTDLSIIHRNAQHLSELVDDVLDLSQIEAGQMALTREKAPIGEIIQEAADAVRPLFETKNLYLRVDAANDLPPLFCDRTRIREVLLNLLSNAGRFTEKGGVCLRAWREKDDLVVAVTDTGPGIAPEAQRRLFEPFCQADNSIRRRYGGTGLGLSISKQFIELHGGQIQVASQPDQGTTFSFRLPLTLPDLSDPDAPGTTGFGRGMIPGWEFFERTRPSTAPKGPVSPRFVVLEQGNVLQRLLARYIGDVEIAHVATMDEALRALEAQPARALLVNALSITEGLGRMEHVALPPGMPVLICSVPGAPESADAFGVADYLVKPISREALLDALDRAGAPAGTVLVVEDNPEASRLFHRMLAASGKPYRVVRATDGRQALAILHEDMPDAILLDLVMPVMDGFQLLETIHQDPELRHIPIIIISATDPSGQPIVSRGLAVTTQGGLSAHRVLACIKALEEILSPAGLSAAPTPRAMPAD